MGLTAYECVMTGVVGITFYFDLFQIVLQEIDILFHEILKYRLLIKVGPGTNGDINNVRHLFPPSFDFVRKMAAGTKA